MFMRDSTTPGESLGTRVQARGKTCPRSSLFVKLVQSGASTLAKVIWIVVILVLPIFGLVIWLLSGPR